MGDGESDDIVDSMMYGLLSGLKTRDEVKSYLIFPMMDRDFPPPKETTIEFKQEYQWTVISDLDFTNDMLTDDIIRDARERVRRWDEICFMDVIKPKPVIATEIPLLMLPPGKDIKDGQ